MVCVSSELETRELLPFMHKRCVLVGSRARHLSALQTVYTFAHQLICLQLHCEGCALRSPSGRLGITDGALALAPWPWLRPPPVGPSPNLLALTQAPNADSSCTSCLAPTLSTSMGSKFGVVEESRVCEQTPKERSHGRGQGHGEHTRSRAEPEHSRAGVRRSASSAS